MTSEQRQNLDKKILEFDSFMEFHSYAYEHDIIFDNEEWQEYSTKLKTLLEKKESNIIKVNLDNLILP